jgi:hypothetical protein
MAPIAVADEIDLDVRLGLAVTGRCCREDLDANPDATLEKLASASPLVAKFVSLRGLLEEGQETVRSIHGALPVYSLHAGRFRGATCHDRPNQAVWLLAAGYHRSGDRSDAYRFFATLHANGKLFPTEDDYVRLFERRNSLAVPLITSRVRAALFEAREDSPRPQSVLLPGGVVVTILVSLREASGELPAVDEIWLAVSTEGLQPGWLPLIQAAISIDQGHRTFEYREDFPNRGPNRRELRFRFWRETPE